MRFQLAPHDDIERKHPDTWLSMSRHDAGALEVPADTITVTRNEILYGLNQADKFILAIVIVDGDNHEGPHYVRNPFTQEPDWAVTSINLDLASLLERAQAV
jgi:hypothetical protein